MNKKIAIALSVVMLMAVSGSAFAWGGGRGGWGGGGWGGGHGFCGGGGYGMGYGGGPGMGFHGGMWGPGGGWNNSGAPQAQINVPQNIQDLFIKQQRLAAELNTVLLADKPDLAKARAIQKEMRTVREKIEDWRFEEMLKYRNSQ